MSKETFQSYHSNGKLLITGEYLVLQGALSLAVPTAAGQYLHLKPGQPDGLLDWSTQVLSRPWFHCLIDPESMDIMESDRRDIALKLLAILKAASELKKQTDWLKGARVLTEIEFDIDWGLGSSSSLISNIAWWAGIDPFLLFRKVSQGSGYDVACARSDRPILYRTGMPDPEVTQIDFFPDFADQLAFVYLGRKQDSEKSVKNFLDHALVREKDLARISEISSLACRAPDLEEYEKLLDEHERILSAILDKPTVKESLFRDYPGMVKSLGAWGGDFVHISLRSDLDTARDYFSGKGIDVLIPFNEMLKSSRDKH